MSIMFKWRNFPSRQITMLSMLMTFLSSYHTHWSCPNIVIANAKLDISNLAISPVPETHVQYLVFTYFNILAELTRRKVHELSQQGEKSHTQMAWLTLQTERDKFPENKPQWPDLSPLSCSSRSLWFLWVSADRLRQWIGGFSKGTLTLH